MQVCTSLQTDNHASTPPLSFFTGRMPFLPPNQQHQSTEGNGLPPKAVVNNITIVLGSEQPYALHLLLFFAVHVDVGNLFCYLSKLVCFFSVR